MNVDALLEQLTAPRWGARVEVVRGLAAIDDERAHNALVWALYDGDVVWDVVLHSSGVHLADETCRRLNE